jgi:hypothetical protein
MPDIKTIAEQLDAAQDGKEFAAVFTNLFALFDQARDNTTESDSL